MNREEKIVEKIGKLAQEYAKLLNKVFEVKIGYSGFECFKVEDKSGRCSITMKCSNDYYTMDTTSDLEVGVYESTSKCDERIGCYARSLLSFIVSEFGDDIHSITFTMLQGVPSSKKRANIGDEYNIVWALIKPSDFKSYLDELKVNKYHYQHLLGKAGNDTPLSFGEAYYFALKHYNKGGDGFVECTGPRDFEREEKELGIKHTKKSMLRSFETFKSVCEDRMGW